MRNDQIFVLLLILLMPMTGCFGGVVGDVEADEEDSIMTCPQWINDRDTILTNWSLGLDDDEWLEVKSAAWIGEYTSSENNETDQGSLVIQEDSDWGLGSGSFSPIFGGIYHLCLFYEDGICYQSYPGDQFQMREFSIIYRIHSV
jgi:hypothetical protein